jgi:hypothetical protein
MGLGTMKHPLLSLPRSHCSLSEQTGRDVIIEGKNEAISAQEHSVGGISSELSVVNSLKTIFHSV